MNAKYFVAWYSGMGSHKKWGVYRKDGEVIGNTLVCVCAYKGGAINAANEMNTLVKMKGAIL